MQRHRSDTAKREHIIATNAATLQWQSKMGTTNSNKKQRHCSDTAKREQLIATLCSDTAKRNQILATQCDDTAVTLQNRNNYQQQNAAALQWHCKTGPSTKNQMQRHCSDKARRDQAPTTRCNVTAVAKQNVLCVCVYKFQTISWYSLIFPM